MQDFVAKLGPARGQDALWAALTFSDSPGVVVVVSGRPKSEWMT